MNYFNIEANNIDAAAEKILGILGDTTNKANVIYFDGWNGLGASAALKVVAQRLKLSEISPKLKFHKIIHVDCSLWKSKRALQKVVVEELELPDSVMDHFNRREEEDDLNGIEEGSRGVLSDVRGEIFQKLAGNRFVVIFHNGSGGYIDLYECGIPVTEFLRNKVLWTSRGRFRLCLNPEFDLEAEKIRDLVCEEAREVPEYTGIPEPDMNHMIVQDYLMYMWSLGCAKGIDWEAHASNYWICDGIIQTSVTDRSAWEIGDDLRRNMCLDVGDSSDTEIIDAAIRHFLLPRRKNHCIVATHQQNLVEYIAVLPPEVTSLFLLAPDPERGMVLSVNMYINSDGSSKLRVLHLSFCTFSFAFPPFLCCSNLRFLLLDRCTNITDEEHQNHCHNGSWRACFGKLWVLDMRYTDWNFLISEEMVKLMVELRKLNVVGVKHWHITDFHGGGTCLVKVRVMASPFLSEEDDTRGTNNLKTLFLNLNLSSTNNLKTVILQDCFELHQVDSGDLPPSLKPFSFLNHYFVSSMISRISLQGCAQLRSLLLGGQMSCLEELDISGTAVKTLDLREMKAPNFRRLVLLGCEKLQTMLWREEFNRSQFLEALWVDTTGSC